METQIGLLVAEIIVSLMMVLGLARVFKKAGHPMWAAVVPFVNLVVMVKVAGRPSRWVIYWCIPIVNIFIYAIWCGDIAKRFGREGTGFALATFFFPWISLVLLGFGDAQYTPPPEQ